MNFGLYIHIPYCLHKCGYCDFNSHNINTEEMESYANALIREMRHYAQGPAAEKEVTTLFFGGGTPTTLPVHLLEDLLAKLRTLFNVSGDCEITFEANPATVALEPLQRMRSAGYNRISIGVQSFHEDELKLLDRIHSIDEIHLTVERAREAGFDNLSLDLMFALPGQTMELWEDNLAQALGKHPQHLSTYNLTIEPETAFHKLHARGKLVMPPDDFQLEFYKKTIQTLTDAGYRHYEISNFCKPGKECRHNLIYWNNGDSLGLGAGASSYMNGARFKNCNLPSRYIREIENKGNAVEFSEQLEPRRAMGETLMLGLRLLQGMAIQPFEERFQTSFENVFDDVLPPLLEKNLITLDKNRIALSPKGLFLADSVILEFMN
ncbi:MAG: coproporphyrinogen III oxidase [Nitrospinaceae bacterium]|nr:MAG: coproporphyrinogen III oxidase [Nitrospinaceae bacterium]